jgi:hypothetical protein
MLVALNILQTSPLSTVIQKTLSFFNTKHKLKSLESNLNKFSQSQKMVKWINLNNKIKESQNNMKNKKLT